MARAVVLCALLAGCAHVAAPPALDSGKLVALTRFIRDNPLPIYSLLISRNGKLVYELYTSSFTRDDAHYLMSITKSIVSTLVGIAIDRKLLGGVDQPIAEALPARLFAGDEERARFSRVTIKDVLGMAALDTPDPPRDHSPEAIARQRRFIAAPNRVAFALTQPVLTAPFQYNDITPALAAGLVQYASGKTLLEFAEEHLFKPLGFRNYEWMHQDPSGIDNGGYGLRLRPIDMQRLGMLFLDHGVWNGRQLISREWVERAFSPWNRSRADLPAPNYGWYWWTYRYGPGWTALVANGWKGQRIAIFPDQGIVVTMTACLEDGSEDSFFDALITRMIIPAAAHPDATHDDEVARLLAEVVHGPSRIRPQTEARINPSVQTKERHRPFVLIP